jgi:ankyrin repeat protein
MQKLLFYGLDSNLKLLWHTGDDFGFYWIHYAGGIRLLHRAVFYHDSYEKCLHSDTVLVDLLENGAHLYPDSQDWILERSMDPSIRLQYSSTGLERGTTCISPVPMIKLLLSYGADPTLSNRGRVSSLHYTSVTNPYWNIVPLLLDHGVDINCRNTVDQRTVLHDAIYTRNFDLVPDLLHYGVDLEAVDIDGYTAMYLAHTSWKLPRSRFFRDRKVVVRGGFIMDHEVQHILRRAMEMI